MDAEYCAECGVEKFIKSYVRKWRQIAEEPRYISDDYRGSVLLDKILSILF